MDNRYDDGSDLVEMPPIDMNEIAAVRARSARTRSARVGGEKGDQRGQRRSESAFDGSITDVSQLTTRLYANAEQQSSIILRSMCSRADDNNNASPATPGMNSSFGDSSVSVVPHPPEYPPEGSKSFYRTTIFRNDRSTRKDRAKSAPAPPQHPLFMFAHPPASANAPAPPATSRAHRTPHEGRQATRSPEDDEDADRTQSPMGVKGPRAAWAQPVVPVPPSQPRDARATKPSLSPETDELDDVFGAAARPSNTGKGAGAERHQSPDHVMFAPSATASPTKELSRALQRGFPRPSTSSGANGSTAAEEVHKRPSTTTGTRPHTTTGRASSMSAATASSKRGKSAVERTVSLMEPSDVMAIVEQMRENGADSTEFVYLIRIQNPRNPADYNPYKLRVVPHADVDRNDFYTLSVSGMTHVLNGQAEFTSLPQWLRERASFNRLKEIPLIAKYRLWKSYKTWRTNVRSAKIRHCKELLDRRLFILNPTLREALLGIRNMCQELSVLRLHHVDTRTTYPLSQFCQTQQEQMEYVRANLAQFEETVSDVVCEACEISLENAGFIDDPNARDENGEPIKPTYTELARKRSECRKLTSFIKLADYLIIDTLHDLTSTSVSDLLNHMRPAEDRRASSHPNGVNGEGDGFRDPILYGDAPVEAGSSGRNDKRASVVGKLPKDAVETLKRSPLLRLELIMEADVLTFTPNIDEVQAKTSSIIEGFLDVVQSVGRLVASERFSPYTSPGGINDGIEAGEMDEGPDLNEIFEDDEQYQTLTGQIRTAIAHAFRVAENFSEVFLPLRDMVIENRKMRIEQVRSSNPEVLYFSNAMAKYHAQIRDIEGMPISSEVGIIMVDTRALKGAFLPSPKRCLQDLERLLPELAHARNETLLSVIKESVGRLETVPRSVEEFVEHLNHLQQVNDNMNSIQDTYSYVAKMHELMDVYRVSPPPEEYALYQTLVPSLSQLKAALAYSEATKEDLISKFSVELERNTAQLKGRILELKNSVLEPRMLNSDCDHDEVMQMLGELTEKMESLRHTAADYDSYQQTFSIPLTQYEELDEAREELELRRLLWTSLREWDELREAWDNTAFEAVDAEMIAGHVARFTKTTYQLERKLPPNTTVPKLKALVDGFRTGLPAIQDLRNPALKSRHWESIQDVIGQRVVRNETFTLGQLLEFKVFDFKEPIADISAQATNEATLENMLKKVEQAWATTEFIIIPHRDSKDVCIVGGVDDILTLLEDSQVTVSTIRGSRYVAPIKNSVEEWDRQLALFAETLDEWTRCQRNWLYLENIFTAPDIQRQLPNEARLFALVDKSWKDIMRKTRDNPNALKAGTAPGVLEALRTNNAHLEDIQKCLEDYLETKRLVFPRFYFLSNDELLEILAQTRNPHAVQAHLRKCFDNIARLEFSPEARSIDILGMVSSEGERVSLGKNLKARGNVEAWLGNVETAMVQSLRRLLKGALVEYGRRSREEWILDQPGQVALTAAQIIWCRETTRCLSGDAGAVESLRLLREEWIENLSSLAALVRGDLTAVQRASIGALITIDVHARDILGELHAAAAQSQHDFEWTKQLRYYWDQDEDNCVVQQTNSSFTYGHEYLGCTPRLVITPLTDRCYLTLTGALHLHLGGAPAGPAGTGKTETVKDLSKALAKQCLVFNCSEGLDYKMMGKFWSGLSQSGAWCCFDEFNRIDLEVLSVIAEQIRTIKSAKDVGAQRFVFEGREIKLNPTCGFFITMNPGYAGRVELPDNLKALFRPVAMMIPDYGLIAEIILYSEGFEQAKELSQKLVSLYKLANEQLSRQDHYDFGMRAVKSVLTMAGSLKRSNPTSSEDILLIRSLRDSNLPKFLAEDVPLFEGILADLFPGVQMPVDDFGAVQEAILSALAEGKKQAVPLQIAKTIQLFQTMNVRHGVMLVGPTGGGKSTCHVTLARALNILKEKSGKHEGVRTYTLNPKSITLGELYGRFDPNTLEWTDGLLASLVRASVADSSPMQKWVICDGPVDSLWIENMNSALDDSKLLCLANGERIQLTPTVRMMFEVEDLSVASPATVSRCGMVYIDAGELGWRPYVRSWSHRLPVQLSDDCREHVIALFEQFVDQGLKYIRSLENPEYIPSIDLNLVSSLCALFESLVRPGRGLNYDLDTLSTNSILTCVFVFSYVWSIGGNLADGRQDEFDSIAREMFEGLPGIRIPSQKTLYHYYVDLRNGDFMAWDHSLTNFKYQKDTPFLSILVPTVDTIRFSYILRALVDAGRPVLFGGTTGVGKSSIVTDFLAASTSESAGDARVDSIAMQFSAQTDSNRIQNIMVSKLDRKRKNVLGGHNGRRMLLFVDDLNMPQKEKFGAQPPIELLRQYLDCGGFYDRQRLQWLEVQDVTLMAACSPPGGGRSAVSPRLFRHFNMLSLPRPSEDTLRHVFGGILEGFVDAHHFSDEVRGAARGIVAASVELYTRLCADLLPTPAKSHYTFNLRDLSKVIQGMLQADPLNLKTRDGFLRLFVHEASRVYHDRLIDKGDKLYFYTQVSQLLARQFSLSWAPERFIEKPILFGDFLEGVGSSNRTYREIEDMARLTRTLEEYLDDMNSATNKSQRLVFFMDAIEHVSRISRMIRQSGGNALLVGVGGTGKQSLTKLACHMAGHKCFQLELTRGYGYPDFREDLRRLYRMTGIQGSSAVFLLTDGQIIRESFLEDINAMLNTGEVPNLFEAEDYEQIITDIRPIARAAGLPEGRDALYRLFIQRVRERLHIVLCMSPVGEAFRRRCRMNPSLINCCVIDWFSAWPREALLSVSQRFLDAVDLGAPTHAENQALRNKVSEMCVEVHVSVTEASKRYYQELRRHYYTTPTSYLELINLYTSVLDEKRMELRTNRDRLRSGLGKLEETNAMVNRMQEELSALRPELESKARDTETLLMRLAQDQESVDAVKRVVEQEEAIVRDQANECEAIAAEAQRDLDEALPALDAAISALDSLDKSDIAEIRVYTKPPEMVMTVMEAVCVLLQEKPDWPTAKTVLSDNGFLKRLMSFDKSHIPGSVLGKLKKYVENPSFTPDNVGKISVACRSMCMWVLALDKFAKVFKVVEPKRQRLEQAQVFLEEARETLQEKQSALFEVRTKLEELRLHYEQSLAAKEQLAERIDETSKKHERASKLTTALADERTRWAETVAQLDRGIANLVGNIFVSSACVAYFGAFTSSYRRDLVSAWILQCKAVGLPVSENYSLVGVLADPVKVRDWNIGGLPTDSHSTENGLLVSRGRRWPLMIDPQGQANRWVRNMESKNGLRIVKQTDANYLRTLENAIRIGSPVLMEELGEELDPALEPVLLKQTFKQGPRMLIRLGDSDIDYDKNFRLYLTTKLANPHYMPETCIKVTIINFTVTQEGLEDQLLGDVVKAERPELEELRNSLIVRMAEDKKQLRAIEDRILHLLFTSQGSILDDEVLINTLNDSKATSAVIQSRVRESEQTEAEINSARSAYLPVAIRGTVLYFVIADLAEMDPMYQYSLKYFTALFNHCIRASEMSSDLGQRLQTLLTNITATIYGNVSRGLFERHKLIFSFLIAVQIQRKAGIISDAEWSFLLRGPSFMASEGRASQPEYRWLTKGMWRSFSFLDQNLPAFKGIAADLSENPAVWEAFAGSENPFRAQLSKAWESLNPFRHLILVRVLAEDKLTRAIGEFVVQTLGRTFVESPPFDLGRAFQDSSPATPLIFVLSEGSDPAGSLLRFAADRNYTNRMHMISLGQGQGAVAEELIARAIRSGDWVFLQNCHLASSWMVSMEALVSEFSSPEAELHPDFRLWLSSMPAKSFPVSVLQNGVKMTIEPPRGLRANLKRSFGEMTDAEFEDTKAGRHWKKMLFALCFFNAIIHERKKFGPLGFNIKYDFTVSDLEVSMSFLRMYLADKTEVPWLALRYLTGDIVYGGRVTDDWDRRCLKAVIARFYKPEILEDRFPLAEGNDYFVPPTGMLESYRRYIDGLPLSDAPEVFGMHENASIAHNVGEARSLIQSILDVQPRLSSAGASSSSSGDSIDDTVLAMANDMLESLPPTFDFSQAHPSLLVANERGRMNSLTTVLRQETVRFNRLLSIMRQSLESLVKAIKGLVVMSADLEAMFNSFINNHVPVMWSSAAYASLKPLGSWVRDLAQRCDFMRDWLTLGQPKTFWISGFFFPQGFVTGTLQNHARLHNVPVNALRFSYTVLKYDAEYVQEAPAEGVLIHGLYLDGARWDRGNERLAESIRNEMFSRMPVIHLLPTLATSTDEDKYISPMYKTSARAGVLSSTGLSTNFVMSIALTSQESSDFWTLKGCALVCQLND